MKDCVNYSNRLLRSPGSFGFRGVSGAPGGRRPPFFPGRGFPVVSALWLLFFCGFRAVSAGVSLSIGEEAGIFYSAEIAELTLEISGISPAEPAAAWKLMLGEAVIGEGQALGVEGEDGTASVKIRLTLPKATRPVEVDWAVRVFAGGEPAGEAIFPFQVYPRDLGDRLRATLSPRRPGVFDPGGRLIGLLSSLGVEFTALRTDLALRAFRGEILLVGPGAFSSPRESFFSLLEEAGVRSVLVLDQDVFPDDLPLRPDPAGLSLVLECLPGRSRIIFCQLPLVEAAGRDPAADLLLVSLIRATAEALYGKGADLPAAQFITNFGRPD